jgi:hypothetical protein
VIPGVFAPVPFGQGVNFTVLGGGVSLPVAPTPPALPAVPELPPKPARF